MRTLSAGFQRRFSRSAGRSSAAFAWSEAQVGARIFSRAGDAKRLLADGLALADATAVIVSSACAFLVRHGSAALPLEIISTTLLAAALTFSAMRRSGAYTRYATASIGVQFRHAAQAWSLVFLALVLVGYLTKTSDSFSRIWAVVWYVAALGCFAVIRLAIARQTRRWRELGKLARTVAIVDLAGSGDTLARGMMRDVTDEIRLVGVFLPERTAARKNGLDDLVALARRFRIDEVLVTVSGRHDHAVDAVVRRLGVIPANVRLCPELPSLGIAPLEVGLLFGQPVLTVYRQPLTGWSRIVKRAEDRALATLALLLVAPLMAIVALLIRLDSPGPIFFRQKRLGFNNNVIVVLKFRTMVHQPTPETDVVQARRNDPRVTRVGAFLRRTSIDELPQLINVLRGEMSLVGPRPHVLSQNDQYAALIDEYLSRHRLQPGITGWAQVNGLRGETATLDKMQRRVEHDLAYIDNWSLLLDIKILFLTVARSLVDRNAY